MSDDGLTLWVLVTCQSFLAHLEVVAARHDGQYANAGTGGDIPRAWYASS
jgi:hypothetical protein